MQRVDVPVTDLDDVDDDMLHQQQQQLMALDDLDFELSLEPSFKDKIKGFFSRRSYTPLESYELQNTSSFSIDSSIPEPPQKSKGIVKTLHVVIGGFVLILVFLIFLKSQNSQKSLSFSTLKVLLSNTSHIFYPTTIIVSLDGFHPHYISAKRTPTLHDLMVNQYGAPYMTPSFPSSTFPNHWTLVTGLYPSEHGVVGNTFYDPKLKKQFVNTNPKVGGLDPQFWQGGEPIWETAHKQNVNSAVHMWPGSEVPGVGIDNGPLFVDRYNGLELLSSKVKRVMTWLDIEDINSRPELILTYVPTIDLYGHKFGISGPNLTQALTYVDDFASLMRQEIKSRNLTDIVNLIFVSDHGMAPTSNDRLLYVDDIINLEKIDHIDGWPLFGLRPSLKYSVDEIFDEITQNFNKLDDTTKKNYDIYRVEEFPPQFEFGGNLSDHRFNYRLAPIWVVPKVGYSITTHKQMEEKNGDYSPKGVHGYNNTELLMRALFVAEGPFFQQKLKEQKRVQPFQNTHVYNLLCESLNLAPAPNNGTTSVISTENLLPENWVDSLVYPGLDYEVSHLVEDATYDLLWKPKDPSKGFKTVYTTSNTNPSSSLNVEESTLAANPDASLPKPSDFTNGAKPLGSFDKIIEDLDEISEHIGDIMEDGAEKVGDFVEDGAHKVGDLGDKLLEEIEDLFGGGD